MVKCIDLYPFMQSNLEQMLLEIEVKHYPRSHGFQNMG